MEDLNEDKLAEIVIDFNELGESRLAKACLLPSAYGLNLF